MLRAWPLVSVCIRVYTYVCVYVYMHVCVCTCLSVRCGVCAYVCKYVCMYVYVCRGLRRLRVFIHVRLMCVDGVCVCVHKAWFPQDERSSKITTREHQTNSAFTDVSKDPTQVSNRFYFARSSSTQTGRNTNGKFRYVISWPSAQLAGT